MVRGGAKDYWFEPSRAHIMNNSFVLAFSTLAGTIVGAGIFGLPYAISQSGIIPGILYLVFLGGGVMLLHLLFGEVCLRTSEKHRLVGYAKLYLGNWARNLIVFSTLVGILGALLVYIIFGGNFLAIAMSPFVEISDSVASFIFWFILSLFVLWGIQFIARAEFWMSLLLFLISAVIFLVALPHVNTAHFSLWKGSGVLAPYGVVLFALLGWSAVPEIADLFKKRKEKRSLDNLIVWTFGIVIGFYLLFSLIIVGVSGGETSKNALDGLQPILGKHIVWLGSLFGLFALATSFLVLGNYLKNSLRYDFKFPYWVSVGIATIIPFLLFAVGLRDVIVAMGILGGALGAMEGVVIILAWRNAKKKGQREPEYSLKIPDIVLWMLLIILVIGGLLEIATNL